jgi:hypothetical protein
MAEFMHDLQTTVHAYRDSRPLLKIGTQLHHLATASLAVTGRPRRLPSACTIICSQCTTATEQFLST